LAGVLFGDVFLTEIAFVILPVILGYVLMYMTGNGHVQRPGLSSEFAFINVVLAASALTHCVQLKTEFQKDTSDRIYYLMRIIILLMILAVIIYTILQLNVATGVNQLHMIECVQYGLFFINVCTLFVGIGYKKEYKMIIACPPKKVHFYDYLSYRTYSMTKAIEHMDILNSILRKEDDVLCISDCSEAESKEILRQNSEQIEESLGKLKDIVNEIEQRIKATA